MDAEALAQNTEAMNALAYETRTQSLASLFTSLPDNHYLKQKLGQEIMERLEIK